MWYSSWGRDFQQTIFPNLFLKTPTIKGWLDGRSCSCMLYNENHFKLAHDWVVVDMRYTLDLIVVSIGIIEFFQLVSILTSFCILIYVLFYICMLTLHIVSISIGIYFLHTYIDDLFVLIISLYLEAQILVMLSLSFSIGIHIQALS